MVDTVLIQYPGLNLLLVYNWCHRDWEIFLLCPDRLIFFSDWLSIFLLCLTQFFF